MRPSRRSPSYIIRNPYSYCFRITVPKDLRGLAGKTELRYTLNTGYLGIAKSKAQLLAGQIQLFFRELREIVNMAELTDEQIREMVNRYFRGFIEGFEIIRVEAGPFGRGDTFDTVNNLIQSNCKNAKKQLVSCDYVSAWTIATDILEREGIEVEKGSFTHNKICREILKGLIKFGEVEERQHQGDYSDDIAPLSKNQFSSTDQQNTTGNDSEIVSVVMQKFVAERQSTWIPKTKLG